MKDKEELKLGDGIFAQIEKNGNVVNYKPTDFDNPEEVKEFNRKWKEFAKKEDERMKNYKPTQYAQQLLFYPDEYFKIAYFDDSVIWMGGIDIIEAIEERAKRLGL